MSACCLICCPVRKPPPLDSLSRCLRVCSCWWKAARLPHLVATSSCTADIPLIIVASLVGFRCCCCRVSPKFERRACEDLPISWHIAAGLRLQGRKWQGCALLFPGVLVRLPTCANFVPFRHVFSPHILPLLEDVVQAANGYLFSCLRLLRTPCFCRRNTGGTQGSSRLPLAISFLVAAAALIIRTDAGDDGSASPRSLHPPCSFSLSCTTLSPPWQYLASLLTLTFSDPVLECLATMRSFLNNLTHR